MGHIDVSWRVSLQIVAVSILIPIYLPTYVLSYLSVHSVGIVRCAALVLTAGRHVPILCYSALRQLYTILSRFGNRIVVVSDFALNGSSRLRTSGNTR